MPGSVPGSVRCGSCPVAEWRWVMEINALGVVATIQAFPPEMLEREDGHVVITSSIQGVTTGRVGPRPASKAGSAAVAESLATELPVAELLSMADRTHRFPCVEYTEQDRRAREAARAKIAENGVSARTAGRDGGRRSRNRPVLDRS
ncbi:SDR family NAD(P)-dependent oxidoreductase [Microbacterium sp. A82]|uniref:SDR family NAD(P)-dependent oxidoreductase n=1 Tax=Microbacterium sp. A82 TaxID=3450452 RepID=UPI003F2C8312